MAQQVGGMLVKLSFTRAVIAALVLASVALAAKSSRSTAADRYRYATVLLEDLHAAPKLELAEKQYRLVINAFRGVHRASPASSYCDDALLSAADVYAEMAARFSSAKFRTEAASAYRFLIREYPHSKLLDRARAAVARLESGEPAERSAPRPVEREITRNEPPAQPQVVRTVAASSEPRPNYAQRTPERKKQGLASIVDLRTLAHGDSTRVVVELDDYAPYKFDFLTRPSRLYFDLLTSRLTGTMAGGKVLSIDSPTVERLRIAQNRHTKARLVFDLREEVGYDVCWLSNPPRLIIDLRPKNAPAPRQVARFEPPPRAAPAAPALETISPMDSPLSAPLTNTNGQTFPQAFEQLTSPAGREAVAIASPEPASVTASGERSLIRALGLKISRVMIDAGHGGHDTGSIGPKGLREKDVVLDVSKRLGSLIENKIGAEVLYTRADDRFLELRQRTAVANREEVDLLVSVHANSAKNRNVRGVETYYLNFTTDPWALQVASRENAAANRSVHELQDLLSKIALKDKIDESREFATRMQTAVYSGLADSTKGLKNRGVRQAPFMVLVGAKMPAILVEIGFISNPTDEKLLRQESYRQQIAEHVFAGLESYVGTLSRHELTMTQPPRATAAMD